MEDDDTPVDLVKLGKSTILHSPRSMRMNGYVHGKLGPVSENLYSLYLRPLNLPETEFFILVREEHEMWKGVHITLASFAPITNSSSFLSHSRPLDEFLPNLKEACESEFSVFAPEDNLIWHMSHEYTLLLFLPTEDPKRNRHLRILSNECSRLGLVGARRYSADSRGMHLTLAWGVGPSHPLRKLEKTHEFELPEVGEFCEVPEFVRNGLLEAKKWELRVVVCEKGEPRKRVSKLLNSVLL